MQAPRHLRSHHQGAQTAVCRDKTQNALHQSTRHPVGMLHKTLPFLIIMVKVFFSFLSTLIFAIQMQ